MGVIEFLRMAAAKAVSIVTELVGNSLPNDNFGDKRIGEELVNPDLRAFRVVPRVTTAATGNGAEPCAAGAAKSDCDWINLGHVGEVSLP